MENLYSVNTWVKCIHKHVSNKYKMKAKSQKFANKQ